MFKYPIQCSCSCSCSCHKIINEYKIWQKIKYRTIKGNIFVDIYSTIISIEKRENRYFYNIAWYDHAIKESDLSTLSINESCEIFNF